MKFIIATFSFIVFLNAIKAHAQQDTTKLSIDTIQYFRSDKQYFLNNRRLSFTKLAPLLKEFNPPALALKEYNKRAIPGTITLLAGLTGGVIAFIRTKKDTHFFTPYTITLFAGDLIGVPLMISANKHLKRAVKLYNQEILN